MANNEVFKIKNGLQAGRYLQSNGVDTPVVLGHQLNNLSFSDTNQFFDYSGNESRATGIFFKPDGTRLYTIGYQTGTTDGLSYFNLSTAWDLSTASHGGGFTTGSQSTAPWGLYIGNSGTRVYTYSENGNIRFRLLQYNMSSWGGSSATYTNAFNLGITSARGLWFKEDGTQAYVMEASGVLYFINLTTAWDISTASHTSGDTVDMTGVLNDIEGIAFSDDGTIFYVSETNGYDFRVRSFPLSTAWDVTTIDLNNPKSAFVDADLVDGVPSYGQPSGLYIRDDSELFVGYEDGVVGFNIADHTNTLDLSTGTAFSFTPTSATTVSFTNAPASGKAVGFTVEINGDGSAITWPSSVKWPTGTAPTATATKELYAFVTTDGGTVYYGKRVAEGIA